MANQERLRRALLFMPGDNLKMITKGANSSADSVIMDLEDGVALNNKLAARQTTLKALQEIDFGSRERLVRVNPHETGWQSDDLTATIAGRPDGYVLPKVESAEDVERFSALLTDHEIRLDIPTGTIRLLALIETARGVVNLKEIADHPRLDGLMFGAEDLAGSIGAVRSPDDREVAYAKSAVVIHAVAFGLQAIDTPYINFRDLDGLRDTTQESMQMGYTGRMAIHPAQLDVILEVFTPSDDEVQQARQLIAAHEKYQKSGTSVFEFEGKMIDMPTIRVAQRILARSQPK